MSKDEICGDAYSDNEDYEESATRSLPYKDPGFSAALPEESWPRWSKRLLLGLLLLVGKGKAAAEWTGSVSKHGSLFYPRW